MTKRQRHAGGLTSSLRPEILPDVRLDDLTVVIPAWDLGDELLECIESVRTQGEGIRVLVVDNASIKQLPSSDGVELLHLRQRCTLGAARTAAFLKVETEFACVMDGDDVLLPGALEFLLGRIRSTRLVAVAGAIVLWDPRSGRRVPSYYPPSIAYRLQRYPRLFGALSVGWSVFPAIGATVLRSGVVREVGAFPNVHQCDHWALATALLLAGPVSLSRRPCKLYRVQMERPMVSLDRSRNVRDAWVGRRAVRRVVLRHPTASRKLRALAPMSMPIHLWQIGLVARRRPPRYLRELGLTEHGSAATDAGRTG